MSRTILEVQNLTRTYGSPRLWPGVAADRHAAVDGVSFYMKEKETLGLVGESGCGKTTIGRMILRLEDPDAGRVIFDGTDITAMTRHGFRPLRSRIQMIFQDPDAALNPKMRIDASLHEAIALHDGSLKGETLRRRTEQLLQLVRLEENILLRYPGELSGGEKRRVGIARVLALRPQLIVADELTSGLDVSIQAQMVNLLVDLQRELGISCLFISHDLPLVELVSHKVAVMFRGRIVEMGLSGSIAGAARHPYTRELWSSLVDKSLALESVAEEGAEPRVESGGCPFRFRCSRYEQLQRPGSCHVGNPPSLTPGADGHYVACHFPLL